jgi:hypothetical protein
MIVQGRGCRAPANKTGSWAEPKRKLRLGVRRDVSLLLTEHRIRRERMCDHCINSASSVMVVLRTLDTGQFFSAWPAIHAKDVLSMCGTLPRKVSADWLIRNPWPSGSSVTAASVESSVGVKPAACRSKASAIVK